MQTVIQRRDDEIRERRFYAGRAPIGVEHYFDRTSALPTSLMRYHLEPGAEEGAHFHLEGHSGSCTPESSDELYLVVEGEVVMTADGDRTVLKRGDAAYVPAGVVHSVLNESDRPAELVLVFGPPQGSEERQR